MKFFALFAFAMITMNVSFATTVKFEFKGNAMKDTDPNPQRELFDPRALPYEKVDLKMKESRYQGKTIKRAEFEKVINKGKYKLEYSVYISLIADGTLDTMLNVNVYEGEKYIDTSSAYFTTKEKSFNGELAAMIASYLELNDDLYAVVGGIKNVRLID